MASIKEVAELAGVSMATVSNVFHDSPKVKDFTKAKVLRAAAEVNYSRPGKTDNNGNKKSKTIGVIMEDLTVFNTPDIVNAICRDAKAKGWEALMYNLSLFKTSGTYHFDEIECIESARNAVTFLLSKEVDGIIYVGCQSREIKHLSDGYEKPFVYAYCYSFENHAPSVIYDDRNISYEMTSFLIQKGHEKIGIISGSEGNAHVQERLIGFQNAIFDAGILYNPNTVLYGDMDDPDSGYRCIEDLLAHKITAVFCMNDVIAGGVYDYALSHGIKIPEQLAVAGFDNQVISSVLYPRLTTVALPLDEIGKEAVLQMGKMLQDKNYVCEPNIITLSGKIIYRDSV